MEGWQGLRGAVGIGKRMFEMIDYDGWDEEREEIESKAGAFKRFEVSMTLLNRYSGNIKLG